MEPRNFRLAPVETMKAGGEGSIALPTSDDDHRLDTKELRHSRRLARIIAPQPRDNGVAVLGMGEGDFMVLVFS